MKNQAQRILITGFESFAGEAINPSGRLAAKLATDSLVLPVVYNQAFVEIEKFWAPPAGLLMLGQAGGRKRIGLERVALNMEDSGEPDESGEVRRDRLIDEKGPEAFFSALPLRSWAEALTKEGHPVEVSHHAGTFVCNSVYYRAQSRIQRERKGGWALFVHVPYLPGQKGAVDGAPTMEFEVMEKALQRLLDLIKGSRELRS